MTRNFDSFGRIERHERASRSFEKVRAGFAASAAEETSLLAFGNGCSYGDSCHNDAGLLVPMRSVAAIESFDPATGILQAQTGVLLSEIIGFVAPHGYFLPVTPGTRFVTLGGAIAKIGRAHV